MENGEDDKDRERVCMMRAYCWDMVSVNRGSERRNQSNNGEDPQYRADCSRLCKGIPIRDRCREATNLGLGGIGKDSKYGLALEVGDREGDGRYASDVRLSDWYDAAELKRRAGIGRAQTTIC